MRGLGAVRDVLATEPSGDPVEVATRGPALVERSVA